MNVNDNPTVMPMVTCLKIRLCTVTEVKHALTLGNTFCRTARTLKLNTFDASS